MLNEFSKDKVRESFNKAVATYDSVTFLQSEAGEGLIRLLPDQNFKNVLDLGCGTGSLTKRLAKKFSQTKIFGVDIADKMVSYAKRICAIEKNIDFLCADADFLPLADNSNDLVFSNLMLQWLPNIESTLQEICRVLVKDGMLVLSTLGSNSLNELRDSWSRIDGYKHTSNFIGEDKIKNLLDKSNFKIIEFKKNHHYRLFDTLYELMLELKMLGAHNLNCERHKGLVGKNKFKKLEALYEGYRNSCGKLPLSYEVYYIYAIKK